LVHAADPMVEAPDALVHFRAWDEPVPAPDGDPPAGSATTPGAPASAGREAGHFLARVRSRLSGLRTPPPTESSPAGEPESGPPAPQDADLAPEPHLPLVQKLSESTSSGTLIVRELPTLKLPTPDLLPPGLPVDPVQPHGVARLAAGRKRFADRHRRVELQLEDQLHLLRIETAGMPWRAAASTAERPGLRLSRSELWLAAGAVAIASAITFGAGFWAGYRP
jgi:hypothetical protein